MFLHVQSSTLYTLVLICRFCLWSLHSQVGCCIIFISVLNILIYFSQKLFLNFQSDLQWRRMRCKWFSRTWQLPSSCRAGRGGHFLLCNFFSDLIAVLSWLGFLWLCTNATSDRAIIDIRLHPLCYHQWVPFSIWSFWVDYASSGPCRLQPEIHDRL